MFFIAVRFYKYASGFALLLFTACAVMSFSGETFHTSKYTPRDLYKYHMQGKIMDKISGVEIEGATVKVEHKHVELSNCPSGSDGTYTLKFESTLKYTGAELEFFVIRDGYKDKRISNIPISPSVPKMVNFKLERALQKFKKDPHARRWETIEYLKELERGF